MNWAKLGTSSSGNLQTARRHQNKGIHMCVWGLNCKIETSGTSSVDIISLTFLWTKSETSTVRKDASESESRGRRQEGSAAGRRGDVAKGTHGLQLPAGQQHRDCLCPGLKGTQEPSVGGNREAVFVFSLSVNTPDFNFTERSDCTEWQTIY